MTGTERDSSRAATVLLVVGLLLVLVGAGVGFVKYRLYNVLSSSMNQTLLPGDRILSDTGYVGGDGIRRGDVVMLDRAAWPGRPEHSELVKRVVAIGGDTVAFTTGAGRLTVNGEAVGEDYLPRGVLPGYTDFSTTVPAGRVFVLGDNRPSSLDSRPDDGADRGPVPASAIEGRVLAVAFPLDRLGELPDTAAFGEPRGSDTVLLVLVAAVLAGAVLMLLAAVAAVLFRLRHR